MFLKSSIRASIVVERKKKESLKSRQILLKFLKTYVLITQVDMNLFQRIYEHGLIFFCIPIIF